MKLCLAISMLFAMANAAYGLGEFTEGNDPQPAANYTDWPGVVEAINDPSRVFLAWVNGSETCYFQGDVQVINRVLDKFSKTEVPILEVTLLPEAPNPQSVGNKSIAYNFSIQVIGGIVKGYVQRFLLDEVMPLHPSMTIYITPEIELEQLAIPPSVKITTLSDLENRFESGLKSESEHVRRHAEHALAALNQQFLRQGAAYDAFQAERKTIDHFVHQLRRQRNADN